MEIRFVPFSAAALGAGLMYILDPDRGRRRRRQTQERAVRSLKQGAQVIGATGRGLSHRAYGTYSKARRSVISRHVDDPVLVDRVRSTLGRVVSHPHGIHVQAKDGVVVLKGLLLKHEIKPLIAEIYRVPGVRAIVDELDARKVAGRISSLQGGKPRVRQQPAFRNLRRLVGIGAGRNAVTVRKSININALPETVFGFWSDFRNFAYLMPDVREVHVLDEDRYRWVLSGPLGFPVAWTAVLTRFIPETEIAWKTDPGTAVPNAGRIFFQPNPDGSTHLDFQFSYNPPGGVLGHLVARVFGWDARSRIQLELMKIKSLIEQGPSRNAMRRAAPV